MKTRLPFFSRGVLWALGLGILTLCGSRALGAPDFTVTTPGGQLAFNINGTNSPTLNLERGRTYTFLVDTTPMTHPFHIQSPGVMSNDITTGTMTYKVPTNAANYLYYCTFHGLLMQGSIVTVPPLAPPPPIHIVGLIVGTNIVLRSTGTNTYRVMPEYKTNLASTSWLALTVQTNRYMLGTNETLCGRPPGSPVFIRIKSVPQ